MSAEIRIPKPCKHATGQGVVRLSGRDYYLGKYNSKPAKEKYNRVVAEWLQGGRQAAQIGAEISVNEVLLAFVRYGESYYGAKSKELGCIKDALRIVRELYGETAASKFGPRAFKTIREKMVAKGWSRNCCNSQANRVRRVFRWAVNEEMVSGEVYHALQAVGGLRMGKTEARETEPVKPVPEAVLHQTMPYLPPAVKAMAQLQLLTGARPNEVTILRGIDLDTSGRVWVYKPHYHKTEHLGKSREIYIGPKAQEVLKPWLRLKMEEYLFSPRESEASRNAERKRNRLSPMTPSQEKRKPKSNRKRPHGDRYTVSAYRTSIHRACQLADVPSWSPNQLRHNAGTNLRREHGVELTRIILGHASGFTTEIYAETDKTQAMEVMAKIG
jgi:integrase